MAAHGQTPRNVSTSFGAMVRGDSSQSHIALVFTGHKYGEGGGEILGNLKSQDIKASFFLTGDFYRNAAFQDLIWSIRNNGHYLGAHSDKHLLYCDWEARDSLLVDKHTFTSDLLANFREMARFGIEKDQANYYLPPYEWFNDSISQWARELGLHLVNFSSGTRSTSDYTTPEMPNYLDSETILKTILEFEQKEVEGLNGFILLLHLGAGPQRSDKFYHLLPELINILKSRGYTFVTIDELFDPINPNP